MQDQADGGCLSGVGIRGTSAPRQVSLPSLVSGREGWHLLVPPPSSGNCCHHQALPGEPWWSSWFAAVNPLLGITVGAPWGRWGIDISWAPWEMVTGGWHKVLGMDIDVVSEKSRQCHLLMARQRQPAAASRCPHSPKELGLEWRRAGRADRCGLARKEELHKVLLYCEAASPKAQMLSCTFKSEERIC